MARVMRVLFVSFHYPPFNAVAGLRASKLTRQLFELGVDVRVLSAVRDDLPADLPLELPPERVLRTGFIDVNLLPKLVLGRRRVHRRGFEFGRKTSIVRLLGELYRNLVNFPDGQVGWFGPALRAGDRLLRAWRPDVVVSVASPWTSHLVGRALARRYGLPWVAEYQDPWTDSRSRGRIWPLSVLERALEDHVTRDAHAIIVVSEAWAERMRRRFPGMPVYVIPCGFDPAEYASVPDPPPLPLTLVYTGRLYDRQHPKPLFAAVRALLDRGEIGPADLHVRFFGRYLDVARQALQDLSLDRALVEVSDPVAHLEAVSQQQRAHVLLLFLGDDDDVGWRPAKLYEYLGARRPILVIGGTVEHEAARIVRDCRAGVALFDPEAIAAQLRSWVRELRETGRVVYHGDPNAVTPYAWPRLAAAAYDALSETVRGAAADKRHVSVSAQRARQRASTSRSGKRG